MNKQPKLAIVVPCYNESEVLYETSARLTGQLIRMMNSNLISPESFILFVNDGSSDNTWQIINDLHKNSKYIAGISLAHNKGHQNALIAGLMHLKDLADIVISIDADLQDDIEVLPNFVQKYLAGNDIVYGVRSSRTTDTAFKRITAEMFYRIMSLLGVEIVFNHADYRLMSKKALNALSDYKETNLFLRGITPLIGLKHDTVEYCRHERFAGESKYPLKKMLNFALDGITSFSIKPIRFITSVGFLVFGVSLIMLLYTFIVYFAGKTVPGWATLTISVWALGGLQLLSIGIIGEYIGKTYMETKARPRYFISDILVAKNNKTRKSKTAAKGVKEAAAKLLNKTGGSVHE